MVVFTLVTMTCVLLYVIGGCNIIREINLLKDDSRLYSDLLNRTRNTISELCSHENWDYPHSIMAGFGRRYCRVCGYAGYGSPEDYVNQKIKDAERELYEKKEELKELKGDK